MPQLQMLSLHGASPIALPAPLPSGIRRTITLPSLSVLDFSASARDCGLALAHLILPALTRLRLEARSDLQDGSDVQEILPYVSQHARRFQNTQSMIIRGEAISTNMLAWAEVSSPKQVAFPDDMPLPLWNFLSRITGPLRPARRCLMRRWRPFPWKTSCRLPHKTVYESLHKASLAPPLHKGGPYSNVYVCHPPQRVDSWRCCWRTVVDARTPCSRR
jgi:hypothetical protein